MNNKYIHRIITIQFVIIVFFISCIQEKQKKIVTANDFDISDFNPLTNWNIDSSGNDNSSATNKFINLDYNNAMDGFIIPGSGQIKDSSFQIEFWIKNKTKTAKQFYYKLYYQNESYKFSEITDGDSLKENEYAGENFYGSWLKPEIKFVATANIPANDKFHKITNTFRIAGNPRNEKAFYDNLINNRWKRNPRVGKYSFILVVTTEENIKRNLIPDYIQDITVKFNNRYVNPYYYYLYGEGKGLPQTIVYKSPVILSVKAQPDLGRGIFIEPNDFKDNKDLNNYYKCNCGETSENKRNAAFTQFIHYVDESTKFYNIPVISDILGDNYSKMDYNWNKEFYKKEELILTKPQTAKHPCEDVISDPVKHKIIIKNPKSTFGNWKKQNVGIITRHGMTYGKITVKAKLTQLLSKNGVWNGLTNAIWMINQGGDWNQRRICRKEGYLATYWGGAKDKRAETIGYSEIDFEILKTVPYCPSYQFEPAYNVRFPDQYDITAWNTNLPDDVAEHNQDIVVACTNWDMACPEPSNFNSGCNSIKYKNQAFETHRWDKLYRAITEKTYQNDDELFASDYYYFQIEWKPTEIIWRIGPEKNKLRVVGYVDNTVTSIPNNQMLLIITQEFHNTKWWPGSPFSQDNLPFPKNDIIGEIYEVTFE